MKRDLMFWIIMIGFLIFAFILMAKFAFAECLNSTQVDTINQLANMTNISNTSLIDLFNTSCYYYKVNISTLEGKTSSLNSSLNSTSSSLGSSITGINDSMNSINSTVSAVNNTLFSEDGKLEARLNTKYELDIGRLINETYANKSVELFDVFIGNVSNLIDRNFTMLKAMIEQVEKSAYEKLATKNDMNVTRDYMTNQIMQFDNKYANETGNLKFWIGGAVLAVVIIMYFLRTKTTYPKVLSKLKLTGFRKIPLQLEEETELEEKSNIAKMRSFILEQKQFSGKARADAYKKFMDGEIDTEEDALNHMELFDLESKGGKTARKTK